MLELAGAELTELGARDKGKYNIGRKPLLDGRLDPQCVCGVNQDTRVLWSNDGIDYGGEIIDIGKGLDTENDIVESALSPLRCVFGGSYD